MSRLLIFPSKAKRTSCSSPPPHLGEPEHVPVDVVPHRQPSPLGRLLDLVQELLGGVVRVLSVKLGGGDGPGGGGEKQWDLDVFFDFLSLFVNSLQLGFRKYSRKDIYMRVATFSKKRVSIPGCQVSMTTRYTTQ